MFFYKELEECRLWQIQFPVTQEGNCKVSELGEVIWGERKEESKTKEWTPGRRWARDTLWQVLGWEDRESFHPISFGERAHQIAIAYTMKGLNSVFKFCELFQVWNPVILNLLMQIGWIFKKSRLSVLLWFSEFLLIEFSIMNWGVGCQLQKTTSVDFYENLEIFGFSSLHLESN